MKRKLFFIEMIVSKTEKNIMNLEQEKILVHSNEIDSNRVKISFWRLFKNKRIYVKYT